MTDKVQKIRKEVERIQFYTQSEVLKQVLDYIDKVQKEEIPPKLPLISQKKCMYTKDSYTDEDRKVLCDGCEAECEYAQKEEPVSEDLEEAAEDYAATGEILPNGKEMISFDALKAFKAGAKWQKQRDNLPVSEEFEKCGKIKKRKI